ncbi:hypothetical protein I3760_05G161300 [Carya illinoinensis]|nr:hypothetical protein I3760_05G161300 [Carya illinoinensis]
MRYSGLTARNCGSIQSTRRGINLNRLIWRTSLGRGKVGRHISYTSIDLNQSRKGTRSSKLGKACISDKDSTGEGKRLIFKKHNMTRNTKSVRAWIIANIAFVRSTITHKSAPNRLSR